MPQRRYEETELHKGGMDGMKRIKKSKKKMTASDIIFNVICYIIYSILIIVFAYPFYYLFICTISDNNLVNLNKVILYPIGVHFGNYVDVLRLDKIRTAALISFVRTLLGTGLSLVVTSYMAYFFSKEGMWHRKLFYRFVVATMYFTAGMIPDYLNIKMLGLMNNFWVYIIPGCFSVYNMILVKTYMESLPPALEESAEIDGAGYLTRYFKIVLPLSKPILATIGLFAAVSHWNQMFDTKMYITNSKIFTLQFVLYEYYQQVKSIQETLEQMGGSAAQFSSAVSSLSVRLTMTAVTIIPIMCVYPFIQKYYMKGIMVGAVKG